MLSSISSISGLILITTEESLSASGMLLCVIKIMYIFVWKQRLWY